MMKQGHQMNNEMIDKAFDKWWYKPLNDSFKIFGEFDKDLLRHKDKGKQTALTSFKAAFEMLMPIIEKQREALEFYAKELDGFCDERGYVEARETLLETDKMINELNLWQ